MKKIIFLFVILLFNVTECMYDEPSGELKAKLKNDTVKVTNKASIPMELEWIEVTRPEGRENQIKRSLKPGETITVKLGQVGGYSRNKLAKVSYNPIPGNESFKQVFEIDLPSAPAWAFTAVRLAEVLNNIWVPGVLKADEKGNFGSFQYMNMEHPSQWEKAMLEVGKTKSIK